jgi:hypothetical protein
MAVDRIDVHRGAIRDLLRSNEAEALVRASAARIATAAGPGHESDSSVGRNRARATVWTDTIEAIVAEAYDHKLTRSLDAGR